MTIEFNSPGTEVKQWVINYLKEKLVELHHKDQEISRAELYFSEKPDNKEENKICQVNITAYNNFLLIRRHAKSYESAARKVIKELTKKVEEQEMKGHNPSDHTISTVDI